MCIRDRLYPVPKIVFLPVLFVLFGLGGEGKVVLIAIAVFFQMMVTMRDLSLIHISFARSRWQG